MPTDMSKFLQSFSEFPDIVGLYFNQFIDNERLVFEFIFPGLVGGYGIGADLITLVTPGDLELAEIKKGKKPFNGYIFTSDYMDDYQVSYDEFIKIITIFSKLCIEKYPYKEKQIQLMTEHILNKSLINAKKGYQKDLKIYQKFLNQII